MEKQPNTYPASEEPLIQVFIKKFFPEPTTSDRTILHKNGKITRNGYEVRAISEDEEKRLKKKEKEFEQQLKEENDPPLRFKIGNFKSKYKK